MKQTTNIHHVEKHAIVELAIFHVAEITCALKSIEIQEIIKNQEITPVHHSPAYVEGVINLRGQIVTIISLPKKFNSYSLRDIKNTQIVVVKMGDESIGLLVDSVDDILLANTDSIDPPPSNLQGIRGTYFSGIYKKDNALVAILNIGEILAVED